MKHYSKVFLLLAMAACWLAGCEKDENRNFFLGGTNPVITANASTVVLTPQTENNPAIRFNWTNPNYQFGTGISSHDVSYNLEFDINSNFNSAKRYETTISKDLVKNFTVGELNKILGNSMQLPFEQDVTVFVRVTSSLRFEGAVNAKLTSNVISFRTRPFAPPPAVTPPSNGVLFLIGNATSTARGFTDPNGGWANSGPIPGAVTFQRVGTTHVYELTVQLDGGKSCLFLPVWGSWDDKYGWDGSNNTNSPSGDRLSRGGGDILVPPASGRYKIVVDFQVGRFTITPA